MQAGLSAAPHDSKSCTRSLRSTLKHYAQTATGPAFWLPALRLSDTVRRGRNYVEEALGANVWEYFASREDEARTFRTAMSDISVPIIREAVSAIQVSGGGLVIDIGGANGAFVCELLQADPQLTGVVLDLPDAMPGVAEESERRGLGDRMSGISGDFFDSVPSADLYLLKFVLHDWCDESCVEILSNVRAAMNPGARLFIADPRRRPSRSSTPDHTEPIHLVNQRRRMCNGGFKSKMVARVHSTDTHKLSASMNSCDWFFWGGNRLAVRAASRSGVPPSSEL